MEEDTEFQQYVNIFMVKNLTCGVFQTKNVIYTIVIIIHLRLGICFLIVCKLITNELYYLEKNGHYF